MMIFHYVQTRNFALIKWSLRNKRKVIIRNYMGRINRWNLISSIIVRFLNGEVKAAHMF